jgi:hypothetical protein
MFVSRHKACSDDDGGGGVNLMCKAFSKANDVATRTVYTKRFDCEDDLKAFVGDGIVRTAELDPVKNVMTVKNVADGTYTMSKSLVLEQTNIFLALNRSLSKCSSDPVKWYIFTAARLLVGHPEEMPYSYTNLKAFLSQYYQASKQQQHPNNQGTYGNPADDVFTVYSRVFGGRDNLFRCVDFARETISAALIATGRIDEIYDAYNFDRETITCNSVSYANLEYFCDMNARFGSVIDILMSDRAADQGLVEAYRDRIGSVVDSGAKYIRGYLRETVKYEPYDPEKHRGYVFDDVKRGTHGITEAKTCGQVTKDVFAAGPDTFPSSMAKTFRGTSVLHISHLCNSDRKMIMSGEPVKDLLKSAGVPVNAAFVGVQMDRGFQFARLMNTAELDSGYTTPPVFRAISTHSRKEVGLKMNTYNAYSRELRSGVPKLTLNELINPRMTVFTLSLDLDAKDLVRQFYGPDIKDGWAERTAVTNVLKEVMGELLSVIGKRGEEFVCCTYESRPDSPEVVKVGLRAIFKYRRLIFKNTDVLARFVGAYKFMLTRKAPALGYAVDDTMYTGNGRMLRLPAMWKVKNRQYSRQLVGIMYKPSKAFTPSYGLVHAKHTYLEGPVEVMTDIGCIQSLIKTPQSAEYALLKKRKRGGGGGGGYESGTKRRKMGGYTEFFSGILDTVLMPAVHRTGGGCSEDRLVGVTRRITAGDREEYTLTPTIRWCVNRAHLNPNGNPCRYFVNVMEDGFYTLGMMCWGCGFTRGIVTGNVPEESNCFVTE